MSSGPTDGVLLRVPLFGQQMGKLSRHIERPTMGPAAHAGPHAQHACDGPLGQPGVSDADLARPAASRLVAPMSGMAWPGIGGPSNTSP